jgi:haloalkane dehalogenase
MHPDNLPSTSPRGHASEQLHREPGHADLTAPLISLPRPGWLPDIEWPFKTFGLNVNDSTIAVTDIGQGPVLLFVHVGMWSFIWRELFLRLGGDFRCVCLDFPGTGQSAKASKSDMTLENASWAVKAVIERLNLQNITLILHDLGGPVGLVGASYVSDRVQGIAAINAFGWQPAGPLFRGLLALMSSHIMREFDALTDLVPRIMATSFGIGRHLDARARDAFLAGVRSHSCRALHYYLGDALRSNALFGRLALALTGPFRRLPLLTIFGEGHDPLDLQRRWKQVFPDGFQIVVPNANHFPMCDDPDLVARSIYAWHSERVAPRFPAEESQEGERKLTDEDHHFS